MANREKKIDEFQDWVVSTLNSELFKSSIIVALKTGSPNKGVDFMVSLSKYVLPTYRSEDREVEVQDPNITINFNELRDENDKKY